jgi:hypothetical protein
LSFYKAFSLIRERLCFWHLGNWLISADTVTGCFDTALHDYAPEAILQSKHGKLCQIIK